jgi:hypothetical protein
MLGHKIIFIYTSPAWTSINSSLQGIGPACSWSVLINCTAVFIKKWALFFIVSHHKHNSREKRMAGRSQPGMAAHELLRRYGESIFQPDNIIGIQYQVQFPAA